MYVCVVLFSESVREVHAGVCLCSRGYFCGFDASPSVSVSVRLNGDCSRSSLRCLFTIFSLVKTHLPKGVKSKLAAQKTVGTFHLSLHLVPHQFFIYNHPRGRGISSPPRVERALDPPYRSRGLEPIFSSGHFALEKECFYHLVLPIC